MSGILYLVPTPIGNLGDISQRMAEALEQADFIAAEDTRVSVKLLNHLGLKKPMVSYYEHNLRERGQMILTRILDGEDCAIVTDAGMPCISDPGEDLVRLCAENGVETVVVPGPSAAVAALAVSGLSTARFSFEGFLSVKRSSRMEHLEQARTQTATMIFYEAPHHLKKTLQELAAVLGDRKITLCRELTKRFETVMPTTIFAATDYFETNDPRGEYVLVIEGKSYEEKKQEAQKNWLEMPVEEHVALYESQGFDRKEAMKKAAKDRGVSKRDIYQSLL